MDDSAKRTQEMRIMRRRKMRRQDAILNTVSACLAGATLILLAWFVLIFLNPRIPINPFPPLGSGTIFNGAPVNPVPFDATPAGLAPTAGVPVKIATPTVILTPTQSIPPTPNFTPTATLQSVAEILGPTSTLAVNPSPTRAGYVYPYMLQGQPAAIAASIFAPDRGCKWMGIGGQAFDRQGRPAAGLRVWMNGTFNGAAVNVNTLTGTALRYGQAGYEFTLADRPVASKAVLYVRLMDQEEVQISERVQIETYEDCSRSLTIVNFVQVK
jgi:hypothetical protein